MKQRTRMFKTLVCLAAAMTGTSALLGWIDPSPPIQTEILPFEKALGQARALVGADVTISQARWRKIEITAGPPLVDSAAYLTAKADQARYHFHVDLEGQTTRASNWPRQRFFDEQPRTVRVQVACRKAHHPMSRVQWQSVQALIAALHEIAASEGVALPVHLETGWAEVYGLDPSTSLQIAPMEHSPV